MIEKTQFDIKAEKEALRKEFEEDLRLIIENYAGSPWYWMYDEEIAEDIKTFADKWGPKLK